MKSICSKKKEERREEKTSSLNLLYCHLLLAIYLFTLYLLYEFFIGEKLFSAEMFNFAFGAIFRHCFERYK